MDVGRCHVPARHDWWVHLSLPGPSSAFFAPLLLWKWIAPRKMEKSWPGKKKKPAFTIPQRHIYFILKGRFEVTLQSFPSDIFRLDILWHFQLNIADIPAEELKACLKGTPALKLPLFLSILLLLPHSFLLSLSPSLHHQHSSSLLSARQTQAYMHYLLSAVDLHLQVLEEVVFNLEGLPKILSPRIYGRQTRWLCEWRQLMVLFLSRNSKIKTAVRLQHTCRREQNGLIQVSYTAGWKNIHLYEPTACRS